MPNLVRLQDHLAAETGQGLIAADVAAVIRAIAEAGRDLADLIAAGPLRADHAAASNGDGHGDAPKGLDVIADAHFIDALRAAPVAAVASEEQAEPITLAAGHRLAVAIDPLDGSGNIGIGAPVGTVFGILPESEGFLCPGSAQLAAGYILYGPFVSLVVAWGTGTNMFVLDRASGDFLLAAAPRVPAQTHSYAINTSNRRHWPSGIARYVRDCVQGVDGPRHADTNMRWLAAMVGEAHRILMQGGIYLYPADARPDYQRGRLRLVYEANPIAYLMEQAGGAATDGPRRILDIVPAALHEKIPLVFGSAEEVARLADYLADRDPMTSPLFRNRSLFNDASTASGRA
jgi:fructose-1,6-bisphosphatase I